MSLQTMVEVTNKEILKEIPMLNQKCVNLKPDAIGAKQVNCLPARDLRKRNGKVGETLEERHVKL